MYYNKFQRYLILLFIIALTAQNLKCYSNYLAPNGTNFGKSLNTHTRDIKIKRTKARILYYSNSTATQQLLISGDIEKNPGPGFPAPKCQTCKKTARCNQKRLLCELCNEVCHAACSTLKQNISNSRIPSLWTCPNCIHCVLPFFSTRDLSEYLDVQNNTEIQNLSNLSDVENPHLDILNSSLKHTSIAHLNVQSLFSTFNEFYLMMNTYNFDIVAVTETWMTDYNTQKKYVEVPGYESVMNNRSIIKINGEEKRGGGVGLYFKEGISFKERKDLKKIDPTLETCWCEVRGTRNSMPYLIGVIYQPSSNESIKTKWLENFDHLMTEIYCKWTGPIILTGDTNIDLLKDNANIQRYKQILHSFSLQQYITKPTRKGKKLIDHICSNIGKKPIHQNVIETDEISDHDMPFAILNIKKDRYEPRYKYVRSEKNLNMNNYCKDFHELPLNLVYSFDQPDDQLSTFNKLITDCIDNHAPVKRIKLTRPVAPWMNAPEVKIAKQAFENERRKKQQNQADYDISSYRDLRNNLKKTIKTTKASFLKKSLSSKNPKIVWGTINRIIRQQNKRIKHHPADLNNHFTTLASRLTGKENTHHSANQCNFNDESGSHQFRIHSTNFNEVKKILLNLKNDCSSGHDGIPVRFIKPVADYITSPLVHIINNCIEKGIFPDTWKVARVCPIPKEEHPKDVTEYRPISILPVLSKIYERVILSQLCDYIEHQALYNDTQSGFRKGHSTTSILLKLRDDIQKAMNKSEVTLAVLIDYSKAFDTIDHNLLLEKLSKLNFSNHTLKLISSYLTNRKQYVQVDDKLSSVKPTFFGVPQGSILGPVLFNLYVTNLSDVIKSNSMQYADDTSMYRHCKVKILESCAKELEEDLTNLSIWSNEQNLLFNNEKTKFMIFSTTQMSTKHKLCDKTNLISYNNKPIERTENTKILGIQFQQNLKWNDHINKLIKSSCATLRTLRLFKRFTPFSVRKTLAESLVLSKINYCNVVYGQLPDYLLNRLQRTQTTAAGYVLGKYANITDVINLHWLPIKENIEFNVSKLTYNALHDTKWPSYMKIDNTIIESAKMKTINKTDSKTFNDQVNSCYHDMRKNEFNNTNRVDFLKRAKAYYTDKALARALSM